MANPNYQQDKSVAYKALAKDKEITGDWVDVPAASVPYEDYWYALDDKSDRDRAFVQIHRWVDLLEVNRDRAIPVADWLILEKTPARKGEYLGHVQAVEVPAWEKTAEEFQIAKNNRTGQKRLNVDFTVRLPNRQYPALLIDFEGGKNTQLRVGNRLFTEDEPMDMLVLGPDGRLVLHSTVDDQHLNPDREERVEAWKKRIDDIKKGVHPGPKNSSNFNRMGLPGLPGGRGAPGGGPGGGTGGNG
jgi:hypothetical protein